MPVGVGTVSALPTAPKPAPERDYPADLEATRGFRTTDGFEFVGDNADANNHLFQLEQGQLAYDKIEMKLGESEYVSLKDFRNPYFNEQMKQSLEERAKNGDAAAQSALMDPIWQLTKPTIGGGGIAYVDPGGNGRVDLEVGKNVYDRVLGGELTIGSVEDLRKKKEYLETYGEKRATYSIAVLSTDPKKMKQDGLLPTYDFVDPENPKFDLTETAFSLGIGIEGEVDGEGFNTNSFEDFEQLAYKLAFGDTKVGDFNDYYQVKQDIFGNQWVDAKGPVDRKGGPELFGGDADPAKWAWERSSEFVFEPAAEGAAAASELFSRSAGLVLAAKDQLAAESVARWKQNMSGDFSDELKIDEDVIKARANVERAAARLDIGKLTVPTPMGASVKLDKNGQVVTSDNPSWYKAYTDQYMDNPEALGFQELSPETLIVSELVGFAATGGFSAVWQGGKAIYSGGKAFLGEVAQRTARRQLFYRLGKDASRESAPNVFRHYGNIGLDIFKSSPSLSKALRPSLASVGIDAVEVGRGAAARNISNIAMRTLYHSQALSLADQIVKLDMPVLSQGGQAYLDANQAVNEMFAGMAGGIGNMAIAMSKPLGDSLPGKILYMLGGGLNQGRYQQDSEQFLSGNGGEYNGFARDSNDTIGQLTDSIFLTLGPIAASWSIAGAAKTTSVKASQAKFIKDHGLKVEGEKAIDILGQMAAVGLYQGIAWQQFKDSVGDDQAKALQLTMYYGSVEKATNALTAGKGGLGKAAMRDTVEKIYGDVSFNQTFREGLKRSLQGGLDPSFDLLTAASRESDKLVWGRLRDLIANPKSAKLIGLEMGTSIMSEGTAEGVQTFLEAYANNENPDALLPEFVAQGLTGAVLGAAMGGLLKGLWGGTNVAFSLPQSTVTPFTQLDQKLDSQDKQAQQEKLHYIKNIEEGMNSVLPQEARDSDLAFKLVDINTVADIDDGGNFVFRDDPISQIAKQKYEEGSFSMLDEETISNKDTFTDWSSREGQLHFGLIPTGSEKGDAVVASHFGFRHNRSFTIIPGRGGQTGGEFTLTGDKEPFKIGWVKDGYWWEGKLNVSKLQADMSSGIFKPNSFLTNKYVESTTRVVKSDELPKGYAATDAKIRHVEGDKFEYDVVDNYQETERKREEERKEEARVEKKREQVVEIKTDAKGKEYQTIYGYKIAEDPINLENTPAGKSLKKKESDLKIQLQSLFDSRFGEGEVQLGKVVLDPKYVELAKAPNARVPNILMPGMEINYTGPANLNQEIEQVFSELMEGGKSVEGDDIILDADSPITYFSEEDDFSGVAINAPDEESQTEKPSSGGPKVVAFNQEEQITKEKPKFRELPSYLSNFSNLPISSLNTIQEELEYFRQSGASTRAVDAQISKGNLKVSNLIKEVIRNNRRKNPEVLDLYTDLFDSKLVLPAKSKNNRYMADLGRVKVNVSMGKEGTADIYMRPQDALARGIKFAGDSKFTSPKKKVNGKTLNPNKAILFEQISPILEPLGAKPENVVKFVDKIEENPLATGMFKDGLIKILNGQSLEDTRKTLIHEVGHLAFSLYKNRESLLKSVGNNSEYKEWLGKNKDTDRNREEFVMRKIENQEVPERPKTLLGRLLNKIRDFFGGLIKNYDEIDTFIIDFFKGRLKLDTRASQPEARFSEGEVTKETIRTKLGEGAGKYSSYDMIPVLTGVTYHEKIPKLQEAIKSDRKSKSGVAKGLNNLIDNKIEQIKKLPNDMKLEEVDNWIDGIETNIEELYDFDDARVAAVINRYKRFGKGDITDKDLQELEAINPAVFTQDETIDPGAEIPSEQIDAKLRQIEEFKKQQAGARLSLLRYSYLTDGDFRKQFDRLNSEHLTLNNLYIEERFGEDLTEIPIQYINEADKYDQITTDRSERLEVQPRVVQQISGTIQPDIDTFQEAQKAAEEYREGPVPTTPEERAVEGQEQRRRANSNLSRNTRKKFGGLIKYLTDFSVAFGSNRDQFTHTMKGLIEKMSFDLIGKGKDPGRYILDAEVAAQELMAPLHQEFKKIKKEAEGRTKTKRLKPKRMENIRELVFFMKKDKDGVYKPSVDAVESIRMEINMKDPLEIERMQTLINQAGKPGSDVFSVSRPYQISNKTFIDIRQRRFPELGKKVVEKYNNGEYTKDEIKVAQDLAKLGVEAMTPLAKELGIISGVQENYVPMNLQAMPEKDIPLNFESTLTRTDIGARTMTAKEYFRGGKEPIQAMDIIQNYARQIDILQNLYTKDRVVTSLRQDGFLIDDSTLAAYQERKSQLENKQNLTSQDEGELERLRDYLGTVDEKGEIVHRGFYSSNATFTSQGRLYMDPNIHNALYVSNIVGNPPESGANFLASVKSRTRKFDRSLATAPIIGPWYSVTTSLTNAAYASISVWGKNQVEILGAILFKITPQITSSMVWDIARMARGKAPIYMPTTLHNLVNINADSMIRLERVMDKLFGAGEHYTRLAGSAAPITTLDSNNIFARAYNKAVQTASAENLDKVMFLSKFLNDSVLGRTQTFANKLQVAIRLADQNIKLKNATEEQVLDAVEWVGENRPIGMNQYTQSSFWQSLRRYTILPNVGLFALGQGGFLFPATFFFVAVNQMRKEFGVLSNASARVVDSSLSAEERGRAMKQVFTSLMIQSVWAFIATGMAEKLISEIMAGEDPDDLPEGEAEDRGGWMIGTWWNSAVRFARPIITEYDSETGDVILVDGAQILNSPFKDIWDYPQEVWKDTTEALVGFIKGGSDYRPPFPEAVGNLLSRPVRAYDQLFQLTGEKDYKAKKDLAWAESIIANMAPDIVARTPLSDWVEPSKEKFYSPGRLEQAKEDLDAGRITTAEYQAIKKGGDMVEQEIDYNPLERFYRVFLGAQIVNVPQLENNIMKAVELRAEAIAKQKSKLEAGEISQEEYDKFVNRELENARELKLDTQKLEELAEQLVLGANNRGGSPSGGGGGGGSSGGGGGGIYLRKRKANTPEKLKKPKGASTSGSSGRAGKWRGKNVSAPSVRGVGTTKIPSPKMPDLDKIASASGSGKSSTGRKLKVDTDQKIPNLKTTSTQARTGAEESVVTPRVTATKGNPETLIEK